MRYSDLEWFFVDESPESADSDWTVLEPMDFSPGGFIPPPSSGYIVYDGKKYKIKELKVGTNHDSTSAVLEPVPTYTFTSISKSVGKSFAIESVRGTRSFGGIYPHSVELDEPKSVTWSDPNSNPLQDLANAYIDAFKPIGKAFDDAADAIAQVFQQVPVLEEVKCQKHPSLTVKSNGLCVICEKEQRSRHTHYSSPTNPSIGTNTNGRSTKRTRRGKRS